MIKAGIQPFFMACVINIGFFIRTEVYRRSVTERNKALTSYNKHFCLIWKPDGVCLNKAIKELKPKFLKANNCISLDNFNVFFPTGIKTGEKRISNNFFYSIQSGNFSYR